MSIEDGNSVPENRPKSKAVDQRKSDRNLLQSVRDYFSALGLPVAQGLSEHATHMHHEDVPDDAVKAPNGPSSLSICALYMPSPIHSWTVTHIHAPHIHDTYTDPLAQALQYRHSQSIQTGFNYTPSVQVHRLVFAPFSFQITTELSWTKLYTAVATQKWKISSSWPVSN